MILGSIFFFYSELAPMSQNSLGKYSSCSMHWGFFSGKWSFLGLDQFFEAFSGHGFRSFQGKTQSSIPDQWGCDTWKIKKYCISKQNICRKNRIAYQELGWLQTGQCNNSFLSCHNIEVKHQNGHLHWAMGFWPYQFRSRLVAPDCTSGK